VNIRNHKKGDSSSEKEVRKARAEMMMSERVEKLNMVEGGMKGGSTDGLCETPLYGQLHNYLSGQPFKHVHN
jgi:hypothetical protein